MKTPNKHRLLAILAGLAIMVGIGMAATLEVSYADTSVLSVKVTADNLNVRSGPGTSYSILGKLTEGKIVTVLGTATTGTTTWYKIAYNSGTAYISSVYTVKYRKTTTYDPQRKGQSTANLNVRSAPSITASKLGTLSKDAKFTLLKYIYRYGDVSVKKWYQITYNNKTAYVSAAYVKMLPTTTVFDPALIGSVTSTSLSFRTGPGTGYTLISKLSKGTSLILDAEVRTYTDSAYNKWYRTDINGKTGYVYAGYVKITGTVEAYDFEQYLTDQGFPESYKPALRALHETHPLWLFKAQHTGLKWTDVLAKEKQVGVSLVAGSAPDAWKSFASGAYDFSANTWVKFDGSWIAADDLVVAYYLDPRNFLTEQGIYQFLDHHFDSASQTVRSVRSIAEGSFLDTDFYGDTIFQSGKDSGVNPNVIASIIRQEQGSAGTSGSISGIYPGYVGYYNYFNIGAYASGDMSAVERGLWYAKGSGVGSTTYNRPWNSISKSITGGAMYYSGNYLTNNQFTLYLKKFNVMNGADKVGTHQYMTHILAAASEAGLLSGAYKEDSNYPLAFYIPVYQQMPSAAAKTPPTTGNNDNLLNGLYVFGTGDDLRYTMTRSDGQTGFTRYTNGYAITVPAAVSQLAVNAVAHNNVSYVSAGYVALDPLDGSLPDTFKNTGTTTRTTNVTVSSLSVYSGPGLAFSTLGAYPAGKKVTVSGSVYADGLTWYKITYDGKTAYINSAGTDKLTSWKTYALARSGLTTANVNIRKSPDTGGTSLGIAGTGTALVVHGLVTNPDGGKWYMLSYKGAAVSGGGIVNLTEGTNTIKITVTSTSGQKRVYTVTVNRN